MPLPGEKEVGGHAVLVVGYDNVTQRFLARNSWGTEWGIKGHFTLPYSYILNPDLATDFWTIRLVN
jgi:C1A family cysteine protease